ncbi:hypothetical protein LTR08_003500 [Meristemomyces frigidus]|nr:hypothetical protein LTR08_003500 [Meristemomyces frigidus]
MPPSLPSNLFRWSTTSSRRRSDQHVNKLASESIDLWEHAALLYHSYEWQEAADVFLYLVRQIHEPELRTHCYLNAGMILARLGDFADAAHTIEAAAKANESCTLTLYLLGIMEWELFNTIKAEASLQVCLTASRGSDINYAPRGMDFVLSSENVRRHLDAVQHSLQLSGGQKPTLLASPILSAECIFEAPSRTYNTTPSTSTEHHKSMLESGQKSKLAKRHTSPNLGEAEGFPESTPKPDEDVGEAVKLDSFSDSATSIIEPAAGTATSLSDAAYHTSWRKRPSTPYIPRDARGEYEAGREVARFFQKYKFSRPPSLNPRTEGVQAPSTRELAKFIRTCGRESSGFGPPAPAHRGPVPQTSTAADGDAQGIGVHDFGLLNRSTETAPNGSAEKKAIVRRYSEPNSAVPTSLQSQQGGMISRTTVTARKLSATQSTGLHRPSDSEALETLLPTVYVPTSKARARGNSEPSRKSIQLITYEEPRQPWHRFDGLHTAASSTSNLYRDSMATLDRAYLARSEAMNLLEGRPKVRRDVLPKAGGKRTAQKPLPPSPNVSRFDSIIGGAETDIRVPSSQIFDYISKI